MINPPQVAASDVLEALGDWVEASSSSIAIAQLDEQRNVIAANDTLTRLAGTPLISGPIDELVTVAQRDALHRMLSETDARWHRCQLGLFPDDRGIPLDFAVAARRLAGGWLVIAEPAAHMVSAVNEQLLALNDELGRAQREIRRQNFALAGQNAKLRELDQLKDTLLANVSHDLRTPLTAILGYAELLRRRGGLSDQQAQGAEVIERNARRLLRLVNDLLLLASTSAGELILQREPLDLAQLAREAIELAQPLVTQAQLNMSLEAQPTPVTVDGDRLRVAQLLDNLVANAVKFSPAGGTITIRVHHEANQPYVEIEDNGPGIPADERERLYEPFVGGKTSRPSGTGLGLAIVRAITDAHHATINLDTEPQQGTRFRITFPPRPIRPAPRARSSNSF